MYGDVQSFMRTFALANTTAYTSTDERKRRCVTGNAPSMAVVANAYGQEMTDLWMSAFVKSLYDAVGQKPDTAQLESVTQVILSEYSHLKITDFMLFSVMLRAGRLGKFYGREDVQSLCNYLHDYDKWRLTVIADYQKQLDRERAEAEKADIRQRGMTLAEYIKAGNPLSEPLARMAALFGDEQDTQAVKRANVAANTEEN